MPTVSKVQNQTNHTISFKSANFMDFNPKYQWANAALKKEVEKFSADKSNVNPLGEGIGGKVYTFTEPELKNFVIKENKPGHLDDYIKEYGNLHAIPTDKIGGQEAIARLYDYDKGKFYLVTSLAQGKPVSSEKNRLNEKNLKSLFNKMFELDKLGIYHGDLNGKNVLIDDKNEVNFIDYQWTQVVDRVNFYDRNKTAKTLLPLSNFPENAQMFEMATMPHYLEQLQTPEAKTEFLKTYLKAKAGYHADRYNYIKKLAVNWPYSSEKSIIEDSLSAERAKSLVFQKPDADVIKLELKKIQFLSDYRDAFTHVDAHIPSRNILASTSPYLCSVSAVQDFRQEIYKTFLKTTDSDKKAYLKALTDYGNYWYYNLSNFTRDTHAYIMRVLTKNYMRHEKEHHFYEQGRSPRIHTPNRDILDNMQPPIKPVFAENFKTVPDMEESMLKIYKQASNIFDSSNLEIKTMHKVDAFNALLDKYIKFYYRDRYLDFLNLTQLMTLKLREFNSYLRHHTTHLSLQKLTGDLFENSVVQTDRLFRTMYQGLLSDDIKQIVVTGYKRMRKFEFKV